MVIGKAMGDFILTSEEITNKLVKARPDLLFRSDAQGFLVGINEPETDQAPVLHVCIGSGQVVFRHRAGLPEEWLRNITSRIEHVDANDELSINELASALRHAACELGDAVQIESGPAFYIPRNALEIADVIEVSQENCAVLDAHFEYTREHIEDLQPCTARMIDGKAVAICRTVRKGEYALECGVDTVPQYRMKGFGSQTVIAWANKVWAEGLVPCYSTQWENKASLAMAGKLGMIRYATDFSIACS